jgi:hypothetical protein
MNLTKRTELRRVPDRGSDDWATIAQILDAGFLAHVGFCLDSQSFIIPTLYGRDGERLYLKSAACNSQNLRLGNRRGHRKKRRWLRKMIHEAQVDHLLAAMAGVCSPILAE